MSNNAEFAQKIYQAGINAGLSDAAARVMAAQAGIESTYGQNAPGNNFFGITKGADWNGPTISRPDTNAKGEPITQQFRSYPTPEAGIADRVNYMDAHFPGFSKAPTMDDALNVLQHGVYGKYYEAPQAKYEASVRKINATYLPPSSTDATAAPSAPGAPVPPANVGPKIIDITKGGTVGKSTIPADPFPGGPRNTPITGVVFHHTGGSSLSGAINGSLDPTSKQYGTGSTYYIDRDGSIYQYAPDNTVRVGIREPGNKFRTDAGKPTSGISNENAISVEIVAPDSKSFTPAQKAAAASLGGYLASTYKIAPSMIVGHGDIQGGPGGNKQPTEGVQVAQYVRNSLGDPNSEVAAIDGVAPAGSISAPTPMPGRPAALNAPVTSAPVIAPAPAPMSAALAAGMSAPAAPATSAPPNVRLPSGQMIAPGTYPANDGKHQLLIADDGNGGAKVTKVLNPGEVPGLIDPLHETGGTVASGMVQQAVKTAGTQAAQQAAQKVATIAPTVAPVAAQVQSIAAQTPGAVGNFVVNAPGMLGNLFHNIVGNNGGAPATSIAPVNSSGSPDDRSQPISLAPASPAQSFTSGQNKSIQQIGQEADNARLNGYREIQGWGPSTGPTQSITTAPARNVSGSPDDRSSAGPIVAPVPFAVNPQATSTLQGIHDGNDDTLMNEQSSAYPAAPSFKTVDMTVTNPAYTQYLAGQKADGIGTGPGSFSDLQAMATKVPAVVPPKMITVTRRVPIATSAPVTTAPVTVSPAARQLAQALGLPATTQTYAQQVAQANAAAQGQTGGSFNYDQYAKDTFGSSDHSQWGSH